MQTFKPGDRVFCSEDGFGTVVGPFSADWMTSTDYIEVVFLAHEAFGVQEKGCAVHPSKLVPVSRIKEFLGVG